MAKVGTYQQILIILNWTQYRLVLLDNLEYTSRLHALELENRKLREEFDSQRAKLKELYLQKEGNLIVIIY